MFTVRPSNKLLGQWYHKRCFQQWSHHCQCHRSRLMIQGRFRQHWCQRHFCTVMMRTMKASIPKDPVPANKSRQTHSFISNCSQLKRISLSLLDVGLRDSLKSNGIFLPFNAPPDILKLFFILDPFAPVTRGRVPSRRDAHVAHLNNARHHQPA